MNMNWDLERIYPSLDSQNFKEDFNKLNEQIESVKKWCDKNLDSNDDAKNKIEEFLKLNNEYRNISLKLYLYPYLLLMVDNEDDKAMKALDRIEIKDDDFMNLHLQFTKWLKTVDNLDRIIESSNYIANHRFHLNEISLKSKYMLSAKEEEIINKMKRSGSKSWQRFYNEIVLGMDIKIKIDGKFKKVSFGELKNMLYEKDSELRTLSAKAQKKVSKKIANTISYAMNELFEEAINICDIKGYDSVLHKVLINSRMDYETLNTMLKVVEDNLGIFYKYYKVKAKIFGEEKKLNFYDVYAPISSTHSKISYEESKNIIIDSFTNFSEDLGIFAKKAFDENWIDSAPSSKKGSYAMCVDIFPIKESRIMTNFSGNYIDTCILAHELGHAYHSYCLKDEELLNTDYPTPIAETASIFCETIVNNELINNVKAEDKLAILERHISDIAYYIVDMYGRFLFEIEVLEKRKEGIVSVEELNKTMKKSVEKAYGDNINKKTINEYSWVNNMGFYIAGEEFINFPYIFGVLFSKGLYVEYLKNKKDFVRDYENFLKLTSTNNIYDVAKFMNIDVHSKEFWQGAINIIENYIDEFISEVNKYNFKL